MAEVTKVCPGCEGLTRIGNSRLPMTEWPDCTTCSSTGRVPFDAAKEWGMYTEEQQAALLRHIWSQHPLPSDANYDGDDGEEL